mmetsp:Transcript_12968/g.30587  ORF Transcript_12968/g.30587 Transcript_12968/m.30587 type:complete len:209 (+) Transcript_12968:1353-1979(+)
MASVKIERILNRSILSAVEELVQIVMDLVVGTLPNGRIEDGVLRIAAVDVDCKAETTIVEKIRYSFKVMPVSDFSIAVDVAVVVVVTVTDGGGVGSKSKLHPGHPKEGRSKRNIWDAFRTEPLSELEPEGQFKFKFIGVVVVATVVVTFVLASDLHPLAACFLVFHSCSDFCCRRVLHLPITQCLYVFVRSGRRYIESISIGVHPVVP